MSVQEIHDQMPLAHLQLGTWSATQTCALTGSQRGKHSVHRRALSPVSHTSQGSLHVLSHLILYTVSEVHAINYHCHLTGERQSKSQSHASGTERI